ARPLRGDQLIQEHVVLLHLLVERLVIGLVADVDGADEVHGDAALARAGDVADRGGLQGDGRVVLVALDAEEFRRLGLLGLVGGRRGSPQADDAQRQETGHGGVPQGWKGSALAGRSRLNSYSPEVPLPFTPRRGRCGAFGAPRGRSCNCRRRPAAPWTPP